MKDLGLKKNCEIVIVPQNLTNKFEPIGVFVFVNKAAKSFISEKCKTWMANTLLDYGISFRVVLQLGFIKSLNKNVLSSSTTIYKTSRKILMVSDLQKSKTNRNLFQE